MRGLFYSRCLWLSFLVFCSETARKLLLRRLVDYPNCFSVFFFSLMRSWSQYTMGSRNEKSKGLWRIFVSGTWPKHKNRFFFQIFVPRLLAGWVKVAFSDSFLMKQISRNAFLLLHQNKSMIKMIYCVYAKYQINYLPANRASWKTLRVFTLG